MIDDRIIGGMKGEGGKRTDICIILLAASPTSILLGQVICAIIG